MTLGQCCGSSRWLSQMEDSRPFLNRDNLHARAERIWNELNEMDWLEAFAAHPKIGARSESEWSSQEQSGMSQADANLRQRMIDLNEEYERKFGFIFILCATGKTAKEMARLIEQRLLNDRDIELKIAAAEQARIVHLRLDKLTWESLHIS